jgi:hypothetical protein
LTTKIRVLSAWVAETWLTKILGRKGEFLKGRHISHQ